MDLILKTLSVVLTLVEKTEQQPCLQVTSRDLGIRPGWISTGEVIGTQYINEGDEITCVKECLLRQDCAGVGFFRHLQNCQLVTEVDHIQPKPNAFYTTVEEVSKDLVGTCATRPCGSNEKCIPTSTTPTCTAWCHYRGHSGNFKIKDAYFGAPAHFTSEAICDPQYIAISADRNVTCLENGTWSYYAGEMGCTKIRTCTQVQMCHSRYADGVYRVFAASGAGEAVVKCSNMASDTPSTETLTGSQESATSANTPFCYDNFTPE